MHPNKYNQHNLVIPIITRLNSSVLGTSVDLKFFKRYIIFHAMASHCLPHHRWRCPKSIPHPI